MRILFLAVTVLVISTPFWSSQQHQNLEERLWHYRNLGKAFYENSTTHPQAVEEFKKALELKPNSARERVNYALALLTNGQTEEGIAQLKKVQEQDAAIPHSWFNLGIQYKRQGKYELALNQFQRMVELVPSEPISRYNLGVLKRLTGNGSLALEQFEAAAGLAPDLAGPHFQLYNAYRLAGREADAERELDIFQQLKRNQKGAAIPEDLEWSFYSEIYDETIPEESVKAIATSSGLRFASLELARKLETENAGVTVLDRDGDARADLLVWSGAGVDIYRNGSTLVEDSSLRRLSDVIGLSPGDFNNDGLADLCVLTASGALLYVNEADGFRKSDVVLPSGRFNKALWIDLDHDYDIDLLLLGKKSALLQNRGKAGFADHSSAFPFVDGEAVDGVLYELVRDTNGTDVVVSYADGPGILYRDLLGGRFEVIPLQELSGGAKTLIRCDVNNDGWTDLAATTAAGIELLINQEGRLESPSLLPPATGPLLFADLENRGAVDLIVGSGVRQNEGLGRFGQEVPLHGKLGKVVALCGADFSADGLFDLALITEDGDLRVLTNQTQKHHWISIGLTGVRNLKLAPGSEVEIKAGWSYQKKFYDGVPLHFGLGSYEEVDTVRIIWPNGLIQNETAQRAGKLASYKEAKRLSGSCPMVFAWNGERFEFVSDILGVAPLGASAGEGKFFQVDHDEYIQISGESLAPRNGFYEIRVTEELREVVYLDQVKLLAIDHPAELDVVTNEKFKAPPFPEFRLFGVKEKRYPERARDHRGRDVLDRLESRDQRYPDGFQRDSAGIGELHYLDLDFGRGAAQAGKAILVLNGWIDWPDGSTFMRTQQEDGSGPVMPYLQAKDEQGRWQTVVEDMGFPAGKPKTMAVDLTGRFLSSNRELRIVTSLCVYWDEIFLSEDVALPDVFVTPLAAQAAGLRFHGFSRHLKPRNPIQPEGFQYAPARSISMWNPAPGNYTRFGDVQELVATVDDRLVVMGSGDELRLLFDAAALPDLPKGYRRDFLFFVDGWAKDGDLNTAFSQTVGPLPFHDMSGYPYGAGEFFPSHGEQDGYPELYNTGL